MEKETAKSGKGGLLGIVVGVVVVIVVIFLNQSGNSATTQDSATSQPNNSPTIIDSITGIFKPESEAQIKCKTSAQKAFSNWSDKISKQFYDSIMEGSSEDKITSTGSTANYKYNYNTDVSLCFMEYIFSWQLKKVSTGDELPFNMKYVQTLLSDTSDPTIAGKGVLTDSKALAVLFTVESPTGSQLVQACSVMLPGHYDDTSQMSINDLLSPTKCTSGSAFDSLVLTRFGIK